MLSYQHGFHAGNHADVLKHTVLCAVIEYLLQKDKPFCFHDTHAGRGLYDLQHPMTQKTAEYRTGIARIWQQTDTPLAVQPYLSALQSFNQGTVLRKYAGSSLLAQRMMRREDRLLANELHPQEYLALRDNTAGLRNLRVTREDGFLALKAAMPPAERRGVVLIDPSYELPADDQAVIRGVQEALKRFATGIYLVWYPVVDVARARKLSKGMATLAAVQALLQVELYVREPLPGGGMAGSGMLIVNPPWSLATDLSAALPWLTAKLAPDTGYSRLTWLAGGSS